MNDNRHDNSFVAEALPTFISEAIEHIEMLEQLLLQLETQPDNSELIDALFRCAHTIKGSAGIFGLDKIVSFTHHVETLLDQLRESRKAMTPELSTLLLQSNDQIRLLIGVAQGTETEDEDALLGREVLVQRLCMAYGGEEPKQSAPHVTNTLRRWQISVRFGVDTYRNGMDPLAILNYVRGMGSISGMSLDAATVPALDAINPEECHLGFDFNLDTEASGENIGSAFSFVRDDCVLRIEEAKPQPENLGSIISSMPNGLRLGEILVGVGAITPSELHSGLRLQAEAANGAGASQPLGEILLEKTKLSPEVLAAALQKQQKQRDGGSKPAGDEGRFIRVQADRLDHVINLLGELVITSAGASMLARQNRDSNLIEANQQITRLVEEIRNGTLQLRMVPIGETFARFRRVVRDTAAELGKDIALEIIGGETELDKSVVERIADPLMHLVRNALDHGLEKAEQRLAAGKAAQGLLKLEACHESGSILIRIRDDGSGINREKVLARAWERGLVEPGVTPSDAEILKLIFKPGFSTAEKITNLSGRGVGMDVVQRNVEALRGSIDIFSTQGKGSSIEIRLPLTLAIIDGFLVSVGASKFIFPLDGVVEVIESHPTEMAQDSRGRCIVELRNQVLPVVSLRSLYALDSAVPARSSVVVIQAGDRRYGVLVDQLHGQHQTVIKPLGKLLRSLRGVSGSSILGSGEVALIFDVHSLSELAEQPASPLLPGSAAGSLPASHLQM